MKPVKFVIASLIVIAAVPNVFGQVTMKQSLTLDGARQLIQLAMSKAHELQSPGGTFAVVDEGGNLLALDRLDGTFAASANVSIGKARTAASFKKPTKFFEELVNKGRTTMVALNDFTPLQGGMPILMDGQIVGAIGVSGAASADQDHELAEYAATAFSELMVKASATHTVMRPAMTNDQSITLFDHTMVSDSFAVGKPLLEIEQFKIHASRRTEAGRAEVHDDETDIAYVVSGSATLVTGGTVVDPMKTAEGETRGRAIEGGQEQQITEGDVFVIPQGVPHWFKTVDGPLLYFVVKPISKSGANK